MIASVVLNLVFLSNDIIIPSAAKVQESSLAGSGSAKGVVTLQIIKPPEAEQEIVSGKIKSGSVERSGVDS